MPRFIPMCVFIMVLTIFAGTAVADKKDEIKKEGYEKLPVQTKVLAPDQLEASLFFWYGCGGCYKVEKALAERGNTWPAGVTLMRMPALSNHVWSLHGRIYLALESMGVPTETHLAVFEAFQHQGVRVMGREDLPELIKILNINGADFMKAFDSPEVAARMDQISRLITAYDIKMVPAMVVNGQYKYDLGTVKGVNGFISMAEELIAKSAEK
ncbi:hypothetical protein C4J81_14690 [Deltaproteobacteria bacterium Smac51]|nr:hypothetical protein C4J81_14690 [Deltaproteobacteria bacterium Smac51]